MSKSYRKAIIKDKPKNYNISRFYHRTVRRVQNQSIRNIPNLSDIDEYVIPREKEIFNDWNYCDYRFVPEYWYSNKEKLKQENVNHIKKWRRK